MPTHAEKRSLPYRPDQLYDLVADIERYPEFLPWCVAARVRTRTEPELVGDLVIGFKGLRERFSSRVTLAADKRRIDVTYENGPFRYLNNHWLFEDDSEGYCVIDFYIDFEFRSRLLQTLMGALFERAVRRMVDAFETRAGDLFDKGESG